ncbi:MAG: hypothetical protein JWN92_1951 [Candidatus Acidoferrum typicum]|nr:hypothetical protein [Candidatus Acidoferrum typicum]
MAHLAWIESEVGSRSRLSERTHHTTESFDPTRVGSVARTLRTLSIACGHEKVTSRNVAARQFNFLAPPKYLLTPVALILQKVGFMLYGAQGFWLLGVDGDACVSCSSCCTSSRCLRAWPANDPVGASLR